MTSVRNNNVLCTRAPFSIQQETNEKLSGWAVLQYKQRSTINSNNTIIKKERERDRSTLIIGATQPQPFKQTSSTTTTTKERKKRDNTHLSQLLHMRTQLFGNQLLIVSIQDGFARIDDLFGKQFIVGLATDFQFRQVFLVLNLLL